MKKRVSKKVKRAKESRGELHPRNLHNEGYDLPGLIVSHPALGGYLETTKHGGESINFANPAAVKALNAVLLKHHYGIMGWDVPEGFLCPPIPGRVDYIHYIADLLRDCGLGGKSRSGGSPVKLLDIGTGANGIYSLLAIQVNGWHCVASDIDPLSLDNVAAIVRRNPSLEAFLELRLQGDKGHIFGGIIQEGERFDVSVCNPPFHASLEEALKGSRKKLANLANNRKESPTKGETTLNFGGQKAELWCAGGEIRFLKRMMKESKIFAQQCRWFTTLVSKSENLKPSIKLLRKLDATEIKEIEMKQGNKITRILAWTFVG
ncbi:23S rRNA (adenine(1618)-N(6))-methyltransferase RlmF [Rubritalea profundi]|uniref:23S rRNA (Adenine(1618)-N(6))-methyltransferase n=1 Tax=Rubritalea profundi TaxID=1658618 RepID=A0A2S7U2Z3_9BACT|nr:23S rRNA (adenine(1618)-N(6))-methyltransferase RlmF [Rubritalea profundi]PQJ28553.1 23S rRNA (adenine(1618)-N(6))-methyltransferase [Rubritalea profundi]